MEPQGPRTAADMIIELPLGRIMLVRRKFSPPGWAIPGGFIEEGESAEQAAVREAREETGLAVELTELFHVYSDPHRDPRKQTIGIVYLGRSDGEPVGSDDAAEAGVFAEADIPRNMAFDHGQILVDYFHYKKTGERPPPRTSSLRDLSESERRVLLATARAAIRSALLEDLHVFAEEDASEHGAAFVTLYCAGELRGCVGTLERDRSLRQVVHDMAVGAALEDPRFPALTVTELNLVTIEISVLSRPILAAPENVVPGIHGVSISKDGCRGVFLPQVARDAGWDRETLLSEVCRKAGLPADAWKESDTKLWVFRAESFAESR